MATKAGIEYEICLRVTVCDGRQLRLTVAVAGPHCRSPHLIDVGVSQGELYGEMLARAGEEIARVVQDVAQPKALRVVSSR